jgi:hypothetical protein
MAPLLAGCALILGLVAGFALLFHLKLKQLK